MSVNLSAVGVNDDLFDCDERHDDDAMIDHDSRLSALYHDQSSCHSSPSFNDDVTLEHQRQKGICARFKYNDDIKRRSIFYDKQNCLENHVIDRKKKHRSNKLKIMSHYLINWISIIYLYLIVPFALVKQQAAFAAISSAGGGGGELASLVGQVGTSVRLPCLIGRQLFCGEPYFIAWYKLNSDKPTWTRIEYATATAAKLAQVDSDRFSNEQQASRVDNVNSESLLQQQTTTANQSQEQQDRFNFFRGGSGSSCLMNKNGAEQHPSKVQYQQLRLAELECAQLEISKLELADEGQYKCEITFSESLEVDKCPPTSVSRLTVIG